MAQFINKIAKALRSWGATQLATDVSKKVKLAVQELATFSRERQQTASQTNVRETPNEHIRQYLAYYLSQRSPADYAVLVKGAWGVGKTFLVKEALEQYFGPQANISEGQRKYCYVSLYGIEDQKQLNLAIARAAYPILGTNAAKGLQALSGWAANVFKFPISEEIIDLVASAVNAEAFVFDDFERSILSAKDCLGLLNKLVEHSGKKVIILADETKLRDNADYCAQKEKVIGKTLEVQLDFSPAFERFVGDLSQSDVKQFLLREREAVRTVYFQSEVKNLRTLRQSLRGFERIYQAISDEFRQRDDISKAILDLYLAFSLELIEQRITTDQLKERSTSNYAVLFQKDTEDKGMVASQKRYLRQDLLDTILTDATLVDLLDRGIVRPEAINADIANSRFFASSIEPWRALWRSIEVDDEYLEVALKLFEEQFEKREFRQVGLVLHAFGIKLYLAAEGITPKTAAEIILECSKYIDELTAGDGVSIDSFSEFETMRMGAAYGLGYHKRDTAEFQQLFKEFRTKAKDAIVRRYPEIAKQVIQEMSDDSNSLSGNIAWTKIKQGTYAELPILTGVDPKLFGEAVIGLPGHVHRDVFVTIGLRYEGMKLKGVLAEELPWLKELQDYLMAETKKLKPFQSARIRNLVEWYLMPLTKPDEVVEVVKVDQTVLS